MRSPCIVGLILATCAGCGASLGTVAGKVCYRDKAVTSGTVLLYTEAGAVHSSLIDPDGRYRMADIAPGPGRVAVVSHGETPSGLQAPPPAGHPAYPGAEPAPRRCPHVALPARYADPQRAGLRLDVIAGEQVFDIALGP
jgi:hypothetical protein